MTDYAKRQTDIRRDARRRARRRRWDDRLVGVIVAVGAIAALFALVFGAALFGAIGIYLGWNLGVYGLAHAVHTDVSRIGFWTAFGASFAIGVLRRLLSSDAPVTFLKKT